MAIEPTHVTPVVVVPSGPSLPPAPSPFPLSTSATLSYTLTHPDSGDGDDSRPKPVSVLRDVRWGQIAPALVTPSQKVRLGPFHLSTSMDQMPTAVFRASYSVTVSARLPANFPNNGPGDPDLNLHPIGSTSIAINQAEDERDIFVDAVLPAAFNIVQIQARVGGPVGDPKFSLYPPTCSGAPSSAGDDRQCLLIVVIPFQWVTPKIIPLAIVYEPPGNCSWAQLTTETWAGTTVRLDTSDSQASRTVRAAGPWGGDALDFTNETITENERYTELTAKRSASYGTVLAFQDSECTRPESQSRPHQGPGKGDLFILLADPTAFLWASAGAANLIAGQLPPPDGPMPANAPPPPRIFSAYAWQIADPDHQLQVELTPAERQEILKLDPFTDPNLQGPLAPGALPKRFVPTGSVWAVEEGVSIGVAEKKGEITAATVRNVLRDTDVQTAPGADNDLVTSLVFAAVTYAGGAAAGTLAGLIADKIENAWGRPATEDAIKSIIHLIGKAGIPLFYASPPANTTVTTTHTVNHSVTNAHGESTSQTFRILDKRRGLTVALYYDTFFGMFAFVELAHGMGVTNHALSGIPFETPQLVWRVEADLSGHFGGTVPDQLVPAFEALNWKRLVEAPAKEYSVADSLHKGAPAGLTLAADGRSLRGKLDENAKLPAQMLLRVQDQSGVPVAEVWVTIEAKKLSPSSVKSPVHPTA